MFFTFREVRDKIMSFATSTRMLVNVLYYVIPTHAYIFLVVVLIEPSRGKFALHDGIASIVSVTRSEEPHRHSFISLTDICHDHFICIGVGH